MSRPSFRHGANRMLLLRGTALSHDIAIGALALLLSLALRLGLTDFVANLGLHVVTSLFFGLLVGAVGFTVGLNRGIWRYASLPELFSVAKTATAAVLVFVFALFLVIRLEAIPRSTPVIAWAFLVVMLAGPRVAYRTYRNHRDTIRVREDAGGPARRVILVGADDNAAMYLKSISEQGGPATKVLGIVDERGRRTGRSLRGVPILGTLEDLPDLVERFAAQDLKPDALILTRPRDDFERHASLERLTAIAAAAGLRLFRLPDLHDMRDVSEPVALRPVRLEDLLQRHPQRMDGRRIADLVAGRKVLITGGGGSIGSELARQIAALGPKRIVVVDASEFLLFTVETELRRLHPQVDVLAIIGNVRERGTMERLFAAQRPEIVFHAAALKHVPIVERQPLEGIFTNAIGTRNVAEAAVRAGVKAVVMVSTDKAVNPANVMGATKRLAEMVCQSRDLESGATATRFVTVRFGNVLGSAGSVVPLFEKQLEAGGPLTVTHPEIERYFMTIPEACLLVLQAATHALSEPETRGRIFVLDMGKPVKIAELARNVIRLSGLRPDLDVKIVYTGLRPGEKLYEELFDSRESLVRTPVEGLLAAFPRAIEAPLVARILDDIERHVAAHDLVAALRLLRATVPEFTPGAEIAGLLQAQPDIATGVPAKTLILPTDPARRPAVHEPEGGRPA